MDEPITLNPLRQLVYSSKDLTPATESGHFKIGRWGSNRNGLSRASNRLSGITHREVEIELVAKVARITGVLTAIASRKQITLTHQCQTSVLIKGDANQGRIMIQNLISKGLKKIKETYDRT